MRSKSNNPADSTTIWNVLSRHAFTHMGSSSSASVDTAGLATPREMATSRKDVMIVLFNTMVVMVAPDILSRVT